VLASIIGPSASVRQFPTRTGTDYSVAPSETVAAVAATGSFVELNDRWHMSSTYTMPSVIMMTTQASVNPAATVIGSK
jgi:hypothetical protein